MSVGFGDDFKEQVRAATNLVDLVSETVSLKATRNGTDYEGLCPFHDDRNPSFHVYPDRQSYRCWVCNEGGDCFTWVQQIDRVTFPEALELLARRANLEIPKQNRSGDRGVSEESRASQYDVVEWAVNLMQEAFHIGPAGQIARTYAETRNLTEDTLRKFRVGYHPEDWNWFLNRARGRFTAEQLKSVGLIGERDNGRGYFDNLVGRIVFPIIDDRGRPVAFGGRVLPGSNIESPAKYWNSPESNIFLKRRTLYAFNQARETVRHDNTALIVEGYMDCVACHQAGVTNAVATLGTALTEDHVKFLKRFAKRVVLIYDGDNAGIAAAERSIERFIAQDIDLRILTLSEGQDPADYLEHHGADDFQRLIQQAPEAWEYKLQSVTARYGIDSVSGREQVMKELLDLMSAAPGLAGSMREDLIIRSICQRTQADELVFRQQLNAVRRKKNGSERFLRRDAAPAPPAEPKNRSGGHLAEQELLEIILCSPKHVEYIRHQIGPDDFDCAHYRRLLAMCFDLTVEEGVLPEPQQVIAAAESDSELLNLVNMLLDSAQDKGIAGLMKEPIQEESSDGTSVPPHLERVLRPLLLRRARNQNKLSKLKIAQASQAGSTLNSDTMEALRRITKSRQSEMGHPTSPK